MFSRKLLKNRYFKILFKVFFSLLFVYFLLDAGSLDIYSISEVLDNPYALFSSLICLFLGIVISGLRWWVLLGVTENNISIKTVLSIQLMGSFFSSWLPGAAGGDAVKGILLYKLLDSRRSTALASIAIDRFFAVFGLFSIAICASVFLSSTVFHSEVFNFYNSLLIWGVGFGLLAIGIVLLGIWGIKRFSLHAYLPIAIRSYLSPLGQLVEYYKKAKLQVLLSGLLSILASGVVIVGIVILSMMYDYAPSPAVTAIAGVFGNISSVIPITPGGLGVGEAVFAKIAADLSGTFAPFATIYFTFRIGMLLVNIPGVFITLLYSSTHHRNLNTN